VSARSAPERIDPGVESHGPITHPSPGGVTAAYPPRLHVLHTASSLHEVSNLRPPSDQAAREHLPGGVNIAGQRVLQRGNGTGCGRHRGDRAAATAHGFAPFIPDPAGGHASRRPAPPPWGPVGLYDTAPGDAAHDDGDRGSTS
jgi:hypothetical protein